jgi:hypothetical protein
MMSITVAAGIPSLRAASGALVSVIAEGEPAFLFDAVEGVDALAHPVRKATRVAVIKMLGRRDRVSILMVTMITPRAAESLQLLHP